MTTMQRQRLNSLMSEIDYRRRLARRIGLALALTGIVCLLAAAVTGCSAVSSVVAGGNDPGHHASEFPKLTEPERAAFHILNQ